MMHKFAKLAPHADVLLQGNTLKEYLHRARFLAESPEAIHVFQVEDYKDYQSPGSWSPRYFGGAVEFLSECFFKFFGTKYGVQDIRSIEDWESTESDGGVDHIAKSSKVKTYPESSRQSSIGSPVYIQTKGTLNPTKEYTTNDGARLPNFYMHAHSLALKSGHCYQARFILFTTGKGLHYKLDNNSGNITEVINYQKIKKDVDDNVMFFNMMRECMNVAEQDASFCVPDPEAVINKALNDPR